MRESSGHPAPARSASVTVEALLARRGRIQQGLIDAEIRATRRAILTQFRLRLRADVGTLSSTAFLTLADEPAVHTAIMIAVSGVARPDALLLHTCAPGAAPLRLTRHRGLPESGPHQVARIGSAVASVVPPEGDSAGPVVVHDLSAAVVGVSRLATRMLLDAGFRAVQCYPMRDGDGPRLGLLSLLYRSPDRYPVQESLARHAGKALAHLSETRIGTCPVVAPSAFPGPPASPPDAACLSGLLAVEPSRPGAKRSNPQGRGAKRWAGERSGRLAGVDGKPLSGAR
ncbi:hypothetical protein ACWT_8094 [Actinoplanes sp. SE50]|uniref:hypothetical protein n=1 Tax=unclassified Actinoplanes TaxID=2626549 RepID=UPI00023EDCFD|nr:MULTISPECIES: hypothetical protein [unclassified Actinoplanes]AEV89103.1 hypothetical protein ACPL_8225 [Actinoplanes sp. SE50/110]ATO87509.1 hypothetical protein ACWT_8094 [Actinoplanes sp. SE50]SLM04927.1 hypothetical protein ACSP50_8239 [Actinoplanes sp. SE50/110]